MNTSFKGTGVAMITPFKEDLTIDFDGIAKIVDHLIISGVDYLVPLGSTGESATISDKEARTILDFVIKENNGRLPIVAGNFGMTNTSALIQKIKSYNFDGIDAVLSSSPSYVKPSQEGIYSHYMQMQDHSPVPIILYNVPGRTRSNMEWTTTIKLAKASEKFIGIKEASGDLIQATHIVNNRPEGFLLISGDDELALPLISCGGEGLISVIGNAFPAEYSQMIKAALNNDYDKARALNLKLYDLHQWLYIEGNPVGIKAAMSELGFCSKQIRSPLFNLSDENLTNLRQELNLINKN